MSHLVKKNQMTSKNKKGKTPGKQKLQMKSHLSLLNSKRKIKTEKVMEKIL